MKLTEVKENMQKTIEATQRSFNTIRTGRASTFFARSGNGRILRLGYPFKYPS